jgi:hypothetical protein
MKGSHLFLHSIRSRDKCRPHSVLSDVSVTLFRTAKVKEGHNIGCNLNYTSQGFFTDLATIADKITNSCNFHARLALEYKAGGTDHITESYPSIDFCRNR